MSLLFGLASTLVLQAATPPLTRRQMYADFDQLVDRIEAISPHVPIKKVLWGYDVMHELARLRPAIDAVRTDEQFTYLIDRALRLCQDFHTSLNDLPESYHTRRAAYRLFLPLAYMDGEYVLKRSFAVDGQVIPLGSTVSRFNGTPVHDYVKSMGSYLVRSFDLARRRFYADRFYRNVNTFDDPRASFAFVRPDGTTATVTLDTRARLEFTEKIYDVFGNGTQYWSEPQVLYLRLFEMNEPALEKVMKGIEEHRGKPIKHVILDVRENGGGNDYVWGTVLEALIARPIRMQRQVVGFRPTFADSAYRAMTKIDPAKAVAYRASPVQSFNFYQYSSGQGSLEPAKDGLHFPGPITVLGNENNYSSGASIYGAVDADPNDQLHAVGRSTGVFLGVGYPPVIGTLTHSKLTYRIAPTVDVTRARNLADIMQDRTEVQVPYTLGELQQRARFQGDNYSAEFLQRYDPLVAAALARFH
ncbi:MAG: hypothetical protein IT353_11140 [Gemmatimonadaceae bacterium]|nr:hypothetical protein [Gemmatimonadaceae bacterium]